MERRSLLKSEKIHLRIVLQIKVLSQGRGKAETFIFRLGSFNA